jgi:hypothetical protein
MRNGGLVERSETEGVSQFPASRVWQPPPPRSAVPLPRAKRAGEEPRYRCMMLFVLSTTFFAPSPSPLRRAGMSTGTFTPRWTAGRSWPFGIDLEEPRLLLRAFGQFDGVRFIGHLHLFKRDGRLPAVWRGRGVEIDRDGNPLCEFRSGIGACANLNLSFPRKREPSGRASALQ